MLSNILVGFLRHSVDILLLDINTQNDSLFQFIVLWVVLYSAIIIVLYLLVSKLNQMKVEKEVKYLPI